MGRYAPSRADEPFAAGRWPARANDRLAALVAMENGPSCVHGANRNFADQHYLTIRRPRSIALPDRFATGGLTAARRREVHAEIASGTAQLVIGTHALAEADLAFHALGLVIIDEQHRFGVLQRASLRNKGQHPDVLVMTATPIPRTLALTTYGDLDVSVIRELPPGRQPIATVSKSEGKREEIYRLIRKELDAKRQAYVIYPLVEESEKVDLRAATEMADHLQQDIFPEYRLALLHGRLKQDEKDRVMSAFARGDVDLLVSTTVVEVGVECRTPCDARRTRRTMGLRYIAARARPRRASVDARAGIASAERRREGALRAFVETTDGFVIAERDLEIAAPAISSARGSCPLTSRRRFLRDHALMEDARREAWRGSMSHRRTCARGVRPQLGGAVRFVGAVAHVAGSPRTDLDGPKWDGLRPTSDFAARTLFNPRSVNLGCSPLPGTGAAGIEAVAAARRTRRSSSATARDQVD